MTASRLATLVTALLSSAGCSKINPGGSGDTGTTDCKLAGEWQGRLKFLAVNGLMLGTYIGVASHWNQAGEINSILWCHGTLEIQAILLAAAGGLVLARAWIAPGPWTRGHAMALESKRAWRLLAAMFPMLVCAGLIEGFVSPHAGLELRLLVAGLSLLVMIAWFGFAGREPRAVSAR